MLHALYQIHLPFPSVSIFFSIHFFDASVIMVYQRIMDSKYYSAVKWATAAAVLFR